MIAKALIVTVTLSALAVIFTTIFQLSFFLSSLPNLAGDGNKTSYSDVYEDDVSVAMWSSVVDVSLLIIFIVQHSLTAIPLYKFMSYINMLYMQRIVYNVITSVVLQVLMFFWHPIPNYVLWNIKMDESSVALKLVFSVLHISCWLLFYVMAISLDITEILGIKWVYYNMLMRFGLRTRERTRNRNNINDYSGNNSSKQFSSVKGSIQHPGLICLAIILWIYPVMRLDRLFLAVIWSVYMVLAWDLDDNDMNYIVEQRQKKFINSSN